ncbi:hypothetical protein CLOSCI_00728 [[Clostridium] scindens ATCC 35704]|nr:hypothetical protein CLOSCI_00728 [[Clostridium] scindens ATCC 35704]
MIKFFCLYFLVCIFSYRKACFCNIQKIHKKSSLICRCVSG